MLRNENPIYDVSKNEIQEELQQPRSFFMNIKERLLFSTKGKVFSHSTEFITFQSGTSAASLPSLSLAVVLLTLQEK